jgi:hypothetical protein
MCLLGPCTAAIDVCPFGLLYISPNDWLMMMMMMKMIFWSNWWNEFGRGNRSTRRKPSPAPLCPPQNPTWRPGFEPRTAAVGNQRLTAWAMAWLGCKVRITLRKIIIFDYNLFVEFNPFSIITCINFAPGPRLLENFRNKIIGPVKGSCEHGNEFSDFIKCWEVLELAAQLAASQKGLGSKSDLILYQYNSVCRNANHKFITKNRNFGLYFSFEVNMQ